jgi:hypothetical protein
MASAASFPQNGAKPDAVCAIMVIYMPSGIRPQWYRGGTRAASMVDVFQIFYPPYLKKPESDVKQQLGCAVILVPGTQ